MGVSPIHWVSFLGYPTYHIDLEIFFLFSSFTMHDSNIKSWITQETNPVYWACTHCLTLEPLDSYNPTLIIGSLWFTAILINFSKSQGGKIQTRLEWFCFQFGLFSFLRGVATPLLKLTSLVRGVEVAKASAAAKARVWV